MVCGSGGSKSRLAKATCTEPAGQMRDKKLHAVVARSTFASEKAKAPHVRTAFGSWNVEKVHTVVARSTFRRQNGQSTLHAVAARSAFRSQHVKKTTCSDDFLTFRCRSVWQAQGIVHLSKVSKTWGFCRCFKNDGRRGRRGAFEENLARYIFRGMRSTRDMFIRYVRRSGRWFSERGCNLEHQIFTFAKMICVTGAALRMTAWPGITFSWQAQYFRQMESKSRKTHWQEAVSSALNFPFLKEVSQNCFVFDVASFENWESLAELLHSWRCQVQKMRTSGKNCCASDVVKFKNCGSLTE